MLAVHGACMRGRGGAVAVDGARALGCMACGVLSSLSDKVTARSVPPQQENSHVAYFTSIGDGMQSLSRGAISSSSADPCGTSSRPGAQAVRAAIRCRASSHGGASSGTGHHVDASLGCGPAQRTQAVGLRRRLERSRLHLLRSSALASASAASPIPPPRCNVAIIGSGPAGYTAAIYAGRARLSPVIFEGVSAGGSAGGQLTTTGMVENFPGFPGGVSGPDLVRRMREQALEAGAILIPEDVEVLDWVDQAKGPSSFMVRGSETSALARSVILATGARARRLGLPAEARGLWSAGISACATCDGAHGPFRGRELAVVGGGDSAAEEALFLTRYAARVHLLVRGSAMRASAPMRERVLAHPRVSVRLGAEVEDALSVEEAQAWGGERLQGDGAAKAPASRGALGGILVRSSGSGRRPGHSALLPVAGLFYAVGHDPNTALLRGRVRLNAQGYVTLTGADSPATSVPGLFAAGDVHDSEWRQAVTAAGAGCRAALAAERFLSHAGVAEEVGEALRARGEVQGEATEELEESGPALARSAPAFSLDDVLHQGEYALRRLYHESTCPILVLYTAPSCAPCRSLKPIIRKLAREYKNKVKLVLIDTEAEPHVAQAAEVTSTPTLQIFFNKDRVAHVSGVRPRKAYQALIDPLLNAVAVA